MRFASLGSGSKGNGTLINYQNDTILIDCGFTLKETERRLERAGTSPEHLDAVVVTHEHGDHIQGVGPLVRKYDLPLYITSGTYRSKNLGHIPDLRLIKNYQPFEVKSLKITPVPVPHDASEPAQFTVECAGKRLGILTDLGSISPHVESHYQHCDGLILEANHDPAMLASGPYPYSLKQRVGGAWGHLSNQQAANFLDTIIGHSRLQCLVVAHISQQNNSLALAQQAFADIVQPIPNVIYACQDEGFDWVGLN